MARPRFKIEPVKMHMIDYETKDVHFQATCNCGWIGRHRRFKVLEDKADTHLERNGGGMKPL